MELQDNSDNSTPGKDSAPTKDEDQEPKIGAHSHSHNRPKHTTRKRVSQACDRCRSRKDKCDGKKPACSTCSTHGRTCSYDANVKKRGLPEGYVRGLEKLWGFAIRDVEGVEENILAVLAGDDETNLALLTLWHDEGNSDSLVEIWRKSQISKELEKLLSIFEPATEIGKRKRVDSDTQATKRAGLRDSQAIPPTLGTGHESQLRTSSFNWPDKTLNIELQDVFRNSKIQSGVDINNNFPQKDFDSILSPQYGLNAATSTPAAPVVDLPDLPSETWHLLDVYFSYTHCWLPIIEKHDILRTSYQYSSSSKIGQGKGSADHAVLWAVIACAKYQHRAINQIVHAQGSIRDVVWTAERMYAHARSLIPNEEETFELGHVQALLILALVNIGLGHSNRAWLLVGQATRVAIDLGLDKPSEDVFLAPKSNSRRKHVFLGCFALDTIIAARLGRRPHLRSDDSDCAGLIEEDGLEEWDPWTDCLTVRRSHTTTSRSPASILSTFNRFIQVLQILNEAICVSSSSKSARTQVSIGLLEKLGIWSQAQSPPLDFDSNDIRSEKSKSLLPHQHNLRILYFNTLVISHLLSPNQGGDNISLELRTKSARQVLESLLQHSEDFGLLIVPPTFEYFTKTAFDVANAVHSSNENIDVTLGDWKHKLDNCLDAMEPSWPVFEYFKNSTSYQPNEKARRESQVAFDLIVGMNQGMDTQQSGTVPTPLAGFDIADRFRSHSLNKQPLAGVEGDLHAENIPQLSEAITQSSSKRALSFGQQSVVNNNHIAQDTWSTAGQNQFGQTHHPSMSMVHPTIPRSQHSTSISSDIEVDSMFNEFAALDAMEWTGNWDQSLVNLGFTDRDNMNQDFYAFCREPDPLFANNVFQQLLASSNAEATGPLDGFGFGEMGSLGFMGPRSGNENEGIEAGQILQALSAAVDQRSSGRGSL